MRDQSNHPHHSSHPERAAGQFQLELSSISHRADFIAAKEVIDTLKSNGFEAFIVGGAVRD